MSFIEVNQSQITNFFKQDPVLCSLGLQDFDIKTLNDTGEFPDYPESTWFGYSLEGELISLVRMEIFTQISVLCHIYVKSAYHKKGVLRRVKDMAVAHVKNNTDFKAIVVPVPSACTHVVGPLESFGFKKVGHMTNMIMWRGQLEDLLWYQLEIK